MHNPIASYAFPLTQNCGRVWIFTTYEDADETVEYNTLGIHHMAFSFLESTELPDLQLDDLLPS